MSDFATKQPSPQTAASTSFAPIESGVPVQCCDNCEPTKLGAESIANFGAGAGIGQGGTKIH